MKNLYQFDTQLSFFSAERFVWKNIGKRIDTLDKQIGKATEKKDRLGIKDKIRGLKKSLKRGDMNKSEVFTVVKEMAEKEIEKAESEVGAASKKIESFYKMVGKALPRRLEKELNTLENNHIQDIRAAEQTYIESMPETDVVEEATEEVSPPTEFEPEKFPEFKLEISPPVLKEKGTSFGRAVGVSPFAEGPATTIEREGPAVAEEGGLGEGDAEAPVTAEKPKKEVELTKENIDKLDLDKDEGIQRAVDRLNKNGKKILDAISAEQWEGIFGKDETKPTGDALYEKEGKGLKWIKKLQEKMEGGLNTDGLAGLKTIGVLEAFVAGGFKKVETKPRTDEIVTEDSLVKIKETKARDEETEEETKPLPLPKDMLDAKTKLFSETPIDWTQEEPFKISEDKRDVMYFSTTKKEFVSFPGRPLTGWGVLKDLVKVLNDNKDSIKDVVEKVEEKEKMPKTVEQKIADEIGVTLWASSLKEIHLPKLKRAAEGGASEFNDFLQDSIILDEGERKKIISWFQKKSEQEKYDLIAYDTLDNYFQARA